MKTHVMRDIDFQTKRFSKTLRVPPPSLSGHIRPYDGRMIKGLSKQESSLFWYCMDHFPTIDIFDFLTYTQHKNLLQNLSSCRDFYDNQIPIFCFVYRSFIESTAHLLVSYLEIEASFEKYCGLIECDELQIGGLELPELAPWTDYIRNNFHIPILKNALPMSVSMEAADMSVGNTSISLEKTEFFKSTNIISKVKKLESYVDGVRPVYELLCEAIHPNSYAGTNYAQLSPNIEGMHRTTTYGDSHTFDLSFRMALEQLPNAYSECITIILEHQATVESIKITLLDHVKMGVRPFFRTLNIKDVEILNSDCMCHSGENFENCCGKH